MGDSEVRIAWQLMLAELNANQIVYFTSNSLPCTICQRKAHSTDRHRDRPTTCSHMAGYPGFGRLSSIVVSGSVKRGRDKPCRPRERERVVEYPPVKRADAYPGWTLPDLNLCQTGYNRSYSLHRWHAYCLFSEDREAH